MKKLAPKTEKFSKTDERGFFCVEIVSFDCSDANRIIVCEEIDPDLERRKNTSTCFFVALAGQSCFLAWNKRTFLSLKTFN